jgi:hypothetical protein
VEQQVALKEGNFEDLVIHDIDNMSSSTDNASDMQIEAISIDGNFKEDAKE